MDRKEILERLNNVFCEVFDDEDIAVGETSCKRNRENGAFKINGRIMRQG